MSGVGHGAAEPGEPTADRLSRQRAPSLGHQLPAGGEEAGGGGRWQQVTSNSVALTRFSSLPQERAEGEPKVKKGKSLLDDDSDEEEEEAAEAGDESVEEVRKRLLPPYNSSLEFSN